MVLPMRFGRFLPRWAKMPTRGQSGLLRGWRASRTILRLRHLVEVKRISACENASRPSSASGIERVDELDARLDAAPVVVLGLAARAART